MNTNKMISFSVTLLMLFMVISITACTEKTAKPPNQKDSSSPVNVYPTDSNVPVDTDNNNVGNVSTVTLDSPVGPPKLLDTTTRIEPKRR